MKLIDKLKNIDKPSLHVLKDGHDDTIAEFQNNFILPLLPDKNIVIGIYEMLLKYIEEPEAVFAIRTFGSWSNIYGDLYVRHLGYIEPFAKEILKAHFLKFACPLNYILTPGQKHHTTITKVFNNDIAESPEFQQYAMEQFRLINGTIYDDYLNRIMLTPLIPIINLGKVYIGIKYGYNVRSGVIRSPIVNCIFRGIKTTLPVY